VGEKLTQSTSEDFSTQATGGTHGITDETTPQLIEVRPAVAEDLPEVRRIVTAAYAEFEPWLTPANWAVMTSNIAKVIESGPPGLLRVAQLDGQLAGTVTYLPPGPKDYQRVPPEWAVIRVLGVDPALRGRGVARALTADCLALARADHAPAVGLHTAEMMVAARALYEHAGFVHQHDFTHLNLRFSIYMRLM
jgi:ribosomal protein S18 acetylase RimI-like enzyme